MAALSFANLLTEAEEQLGLDSTSDTRVTRWLNIAQNDICSRWPWSFMLGRETIVTVVDKSAGTVSVSAASTAVTGVSTAFASTDIGSFIKFEGENDWYNITAVTPTTSLTIGTAYAQTAALSAGTYVIRKFFYSLSSSADRIIDIRNWNTPVKLVQIDSRTLDTVVPLMPATGNTYAYVAYGVDSSGNIQITPYPFPSDARLFEIRTTTRPTDGSVSIPNKYAQTIAWGATAIGFAYLRKFELAASWNAKYEGTITQMKKNDRRSEDYQPILQSIDGFQQSSWQTLPGSYPILP
jgi:hypothetical protein